MIEIKIKGVETKLLVPESLSELTVEQYCEFLQGADEFIRWQNECLKNEQAVFDSAYQLDRLRRMANMIADFASTSANPISKDHIFSLPTGDFERSLKTTFSIDNLDDLDLDRSEATLFNIWAIIYRVIADTKFKEDAIDRLSFEWKGDRYSVKEMSKDKFSGVILPPDITVQEAVEVLDLRKKADSILSAKKHDPKNVKWELLHRQLALLALKDGESLPEDDLALEQFVSARAAHFLGIDAQTALQVDFFLQGRLGLLKATLTAISFSIPPDPNRSRTRKQGVNSNQRTRLSPSA